LLLSPFLHWVVKLLGGARDAEAGEEEGLVQNPRGIEGCRREGYQKGVPKGGFEMAPGQAGE
jgi:hypothetical protein